MSVIDRLRSVAQSYGMLTADEIREELIRQLAAKEITAVEVARVLKLPKPRITDMKKRERRVQQSEMKPLAELLGMRDTASDASVVMMPVNLPSVDALTGMFAGMLNAAGRPEIADELAPLLAQLLPGALKRALVPLSPPQSEDDETTVVEFPRSDAKSRPAPPQQPRT